MPDVTRHEVEIRTGQRASTLPGVGRDEHVLIYQPYCKTCSWVGAETFSERAAQDDADEHLIAATRAEL
jgi:hypothetical protein